MLTILNTDGTFTGTQYPTDNQTIRDHHAALGQYCIEYSGRLPEPDEDGNYPQIPDFFDVVKSAKMADLYNNVKRFISTQPNGWPRYDDDLKLNIMNASMTAIAAGNGKPANCVAVETWIYTVQTAFFGLKAAITAAEDMATLNAIDVSYDWFEANYGREGTTATDPAVSTDDLFA